MKRKDIDTIRNALMSSRDVHLKVIGHNLTNDELERLIVVFREVEKGLQSTDELAKP